MSDGSVLVVILTFQDVTDTVDCLRAIAHLPPTRYHIVVCDNGSMPPVIPAISSALGHKSNVTFVRSEANIGFAAGNAFAIGKVGLATYDFVLLLNNDTITSVRDVEELVNVAQVTNAGIAGPIITYFTHPNLIWQAGGIVSRSTLYLHSPLMNRPVEAAPDAPVRTDFVSGCAMLVRTSCIASIGFLDQRYFYSVEDLEYCLRARRRGWDIVLVPGSRVAHKVSRAAGGWHSLFALKHFLWGRGLLIRTHAHGVVSVTALMFEFLLVLPRKVIQGLRSGALRWWQLNRVWGLLCAGVRGWRGVGIRPSIARSDGGQSVRDIATGASL